MNQARVIHENTAHPLQRIPATPDLRLHESPRIATANNRLLTLTLPDLLRAWDLTETRLTVDVIRDYARLVSGRQVNAAGVMAPLKAAKMVDLTRSLRARAPQLFE